MASRVWIVCVGAILFFGSSQLCAAQLADAVDKSRSPAVPPPQGKATRPQGSATDAAAVNSPRTAPKSSSEESAKKNEILHSERFQEAKLVFDDWLAVQKTYNKNQIPKLKADFRAKIQGMTAAQLEQFLGEMEEKLAVLMSPRAQEARNWLGYFVSAKTVLPAEEVDQFDIVHMSADQIQQALERVEMQRGSKARASQSFHTARQAQVQSAREDRRRADAQRSAQRAQRASNQQQARSTYAPPRRQTQQPQSRMTYYLSPWGGVGIAIGR